MNWAKEMDESLEKWKSEMVYVGKDFLEQLKKLPTENGVTLSSISGIKVFESRIVPDDEMWFIQDGKLVRRFKMEVRGSLCMD